MNTMKIKLNKRGGKIISVYWFAILFIVTAAVVYMASLFYGAPYDVREIEAKILTEHIANCLAEGGYLRQGILNNENFKENFLEECNLTFNVEDIYGWKEQEQYYLEIYFYEFDQNASSGFGNRVFNITKGNVNLKTFAVLEDVGKEKRDVDTIVIHYTAGYTAEDAVRAIREAKLSVHYMIDRNGFVISSENEEDIVSKGLFESRAFVKEKRIAQHAGCYDTREKEQRIPCKGEEPEPGEMCCIDVNAESIGIELVNLGDDCGSAGEECENKVEINGVIWEAYSEEQMESLISLVADIAFRYNIPIDREHIIGHNEVAPSYKSDPGDAFFWDDFMEKVKQRERLSLIVGRSFYVLDKTTDKSYVIEILAIVRKTEKNEA